MPSQGIFVERVHRVLDKMGLPTEPLERAQAFANMLAINKHSARSILNGTHIPQGELLKTIANELEVKPDWLLGKDK